MAYVDLATIFDPAPDASPPAEWGDQIRDNFEALAMLLDPARVSLTRGAVQSIPNNTWTSILWGIENWDVHDCHSTASNTDRVTVPVGWGGRWRINARCGFASNSTGTRAMRLQLNGSTILDYDNNTSPSSADLAMMALNRELELDEGDYVVVQVWQNSGGSLNLDAAVGLPFLEASWAGPAA